MWETSISCLSYPPYWRLSLQPKHVPWLGIELVAFCFVGSCSTNWATQVRSYFEVSFMYGVIGVQLRSVFLTVSNYPIFCWRDHSFPIELSYILLNKSIEYVCMGLFLDSQFFLLVFMSILMPVPHYFDCSSFVLSFAIGKYEPPTFSFSILFWLFVAPCSPLWIQGLTVSFLQKGPLELY